MNANLIITLLNLPRISRKTVQSLISNVVFDSLESEHILLKIKEVKETNKRIIIPTIDDINKAKEIAADIIKNSTEKGIKIITALDSNFPEKFKSISDYPVILYYIGNIACLYEENLISIIGSREASSHSLAVAKRLGEIFSKKGYIVVSGLAQGCDENAHIGCLISSGKTVAILPSGLDKIYPDKNKELAKLIVEKDGCLISEYPVNTSVCKGYFIERDRLQSAISKGLVVVAAKSVGGTMHTVEFAKSTDCIIGCYCPEDFSEEKYVSSEEYSGNIKLIDEEIGFKISTKKDIDAFIDKLEQHKYNNDALKYSEKKVEQLKFLY